MKDGTSIGICGLLKKDTLDAPYIGFAVLPDYRKNGYTFEAAKAVIYDGRIRLGLKQIVPLTPHENKASIRLLEKLSMLFNQKIHIKTSDEGDHLYTII